AAPSGHPAHRPAWDAFRDPPGLPGVIDAAAGFDSVSPGETPAVVSLHATKVLGTAEGGLVICTEPSVVQRVRRASNFGLDSRRPGTGAANNAKMSEDHAALRHAAVDGRRRAPAPMEGAGRRGRSAFGGGCRRSVP